MPPSVETYEKLGAFYLGRPWDPAAGGPAAGDERPTLYDSRDLVTHAVCVGMTGSGKTGLCVCLLEEAAMDGVPALVIDPKGDLGNLLLTFPDLAPNDFRPWIDEDAARRKGLSADDFAAREAEKWRDGLAQWGEDGARIARLRAACDFAIYTPGSEAGLPVSVLSSFAAPPAEVLADGDLLRERVGATAAGLLGLLGIAADPVSSREYILITQLLEQAWRSGRDLDLAGLIQGVQQPPFERVGVLPLESFYPGSERFQLAARLNNLLASPGFAAWLEGEPLDPGRLLYTPEGRPRIAIFSIAHLGDAERMFFVSLLLNQVLGWMRTRPGTSSLRALLYMDEVFGYLPPVAEPPSKKPLLTLLKQARAYGLGVVLATQNPVDLDYKALSNVGTWFLGRLQTERDQMRVLDGLEGAASGRPFDRAAMERTLAGLPGRVFVLHNVHETADDEGRPEVFHSRWAMSYLPGPLTRVQIARLMAERKGAAPAPATPAPTAPHAGAAAAPSAPAPAAAPAASRPVLPPAVPQVFLPLAGRTGGVEYRPRLAGQARLHFSDPKRGIDHLEEVALLAPLDGGDGEPDWHSAAEAAAMAGAGAAAPAEPPPDPGRFEREPADPAAAFAPLPTSAADPKSYPRWEKELADALYRGRRLDLHRCAGLDAVSAPGESERDFRIRLGDEARAARDREVKELRSRHEKELTRQDEKVELVERRVAKEREQARSSFLSTLLNVLSAVFGVLLGRKRLSQTNLNRASSAARGFGRSFEQRQDVGRAEDELANEREKLRELKVSHDQKLAETAESWEPANLALETFTVKPRRADVEVRSVALAWAPFRDGRPAWD